MKFAVSLCAGLVVATASFAATDMTPAQNQIMAIETAMAKAQVDKNIALFSDVIADDWIAQTEGGRMTKLEFIDLIKSGKLSSTSVRNHDLIVHVLDDVAVVQAEDTEKTVFAGKDTSGDYIWTDIFENRGGKWRLIASQDSKLAAAK
jgi:hypothetical protein